MKFSRNDKVFLKNKTGTYLITELKGKSSYVVKDEDGFEKTVNEKDIVPIAVDKPEPEPVTTNITLNNFLINSFEKGEIALVNVENSENLDRNLYIVNRSGYSLQIILSKEENHLQHFLFAGKIPDVTVMQLFKLEENISLYQKLQFQCIYYSEKSFTKKQPGYSTINVNSKTLSGRIHKLQWKEHTCITWFLQSMHEKKMLIDEANVKVEDALIKTRQTREIYSPGFSKSFDSVDLHIEELVDDTADIDFNTILIIQVNAFHNAMNEAILQKKYKLSIIHGKGSGILKKKIRDELKHYPNVRIEESTNAGESIVYF